MVIKPVLNFLLSQWINIIIKILHHGSNTVTDKSVRLPATLNIVGWLQPFPQAPPTLLPS